MKIISTFISTYKLLFFKTTDKYTLDTKIWKIILRSYESKNKKKLNTQTNKIL